MKFEYIKLKSGKISVKFEKKVMGYIYIIWCGYVYRSKEKKLMPIDIAEIFYSLRELKCVLEED